MLSDFRASRSRNSPFGRAAIATVRRVEWANSVWRLAAGVLATIAVYPVTKSSLGVMVLLAGLNLTLVAVSLRGKGPLQSGPKGWIFETVHTSAAILLVGASLPRHSFLELTGALPFSTYAAGTAALSVLIPRDMVWSGAANERLADISKDLLFPVVALLSFVGAALLNGYSGKALPWGFLTFQAGWTLAGVFVGYLVLGVAFAFTRSELDAVRSSYKRFSDWLHSDIKGDLSALRRMIGDESIARPLLDGTVEQIGLRVSGERMRLLMLDKDTLVADLIAHHVERFRWAFQYKELPSVGGWTVPSATAAMLDRVLGDLLSNSANAQAREVALFLSLRESFIRVRVWDNGPGFQADVFNNPATSLFALRRDLEKNGGNLRKLEGDGTTVEATIPLWE